MTELFKKIPEAKSLDEVLSGKNRQLRYLVYYSTYPADDEPDLDDPVEPDQADEEEEAIDAPLENQETEPSTDNQDAESPEEEDESQYKILVFLDQDLDVDWDVDGRAAELLDVDPNKAAFSETLCKIGIIESGIHNWPEDLKLRSKRLLGEALACLLRGDVEGSKQAMSWAESFVNERSPQVSRYWILQTCLAAGSVATLLGLLIFLARKGYIYLVGQTAFEITMCFCMGCVGALLFVLLRLGKQPLVDAMAEQRLHRIEAIARITAGGIAGALVGSMVRLGLINLVLGQTPKGFLGMCIAAMIAGASERLAAGVIIKSEDSVSSKNPPILGTSG